MVLCVSTLSKALGLVFFFSFLMLYFTFLYSDITTICLVGFGKQSSLIAAVIPQYSFLYTPFFFLILSLIFYHCMCAPVEFGDNYIHLKTFKDLCTLHSSYSIPGGQHKQNKLVFLAPPFAEILVAIT